LTRPRSNVCGPATVDRWAGTFRALPPRDHRAPQKLSSGKARDPRDGLGVSNYAHRPVSHRITSSARTRSDCGIASPSAFAVLRSTTSRSCPLLRRSSGERGSVTVSPAAKRILSTLVPICRNSRPDPETDRNSRPDPETDRAPARGGGRPDHAPRTARARPQPRPARRRRRRLRAGSERPGLPWPRG
jgi:hypothetical protein